MDWYMRAMFSQLAANQYAQVGAAELTAVTVCTIAWLLGYKRACSIERGTQINTLKRRVVVGLLFTMML